MCQLCHSPTRARRGLEVNICQHPIASVIAVDPPLFMDVRELQGEHWDIRRHSIEQAKGRRFNIIAYRYRPLSDCFSRQLVNRGNPLSTRRKYF